MRMRIGFPTAIAVALTMLGTGSPRPALPQPVVNLLAVDVTAVGKGLRASKLNGSAVYNDQNEKIGTVDDVIIGRDKVVFAVVNVGGFLGVGGRLVAVPFNTLNIDYNTGKVTLPGATKDALQKLPEFKYA
jgi:sporulation protein YlmC with PRC-barrel domain